MDKKINGNLSSGNANAQSRSQKSTPVLGKILRKLKQSSLGRLPALIRKGFASLKEDGWKSTWFRTVRKIKTVIASRLFSRVKKYSQKELDAQRAYTFDRDIKFSILVPLYNTPKNFLLEMIKSVQDQTYANWELCLADGSDSSHADVGTICAECANADPRIRYQKLEKNLGISGNTNACIDMSTGDYIALFDHDDLLHPAALFEVMQAICNEGADFIYTDESTFHKKPSDAYFHHFKPDFAPDNLRANNYICHLSVFSRVLLEKAGKFRSECDGSQDYDMILRLTEQAQKIVHIPIILYYWRAHANSVADDIGAKPYVIEAAHRALNDHLTRVGLKGTVLDAAVPSMYRISYELSGTPLISILIPNMDHVQDLKKCIDSVREKSTYRNWEIIIIENNSRNPETFSYYQTISEQDSRIRVVTWDEESEFNYSSINNFGAKHAHGSHLLLLNNDIEVITPNWLEEMLMYSQRNDVGAVGAMLYYPDNTVQHAGVILGFDGIAGHAHKNYPRGDNGYASRMSIAQNMTAVTAACMMVRKDVWDEVHGLDTRFKVAFNDIDLCMRIRKAGYLIIWTPFAELYHYESKSRGLDTAPDKQERFNREIRLFDERWHAELVAGDPYYNPNMNIEGETFTF